jgi:transglutaminase-like putative cysteine protease
MTTDNPARARRRRASATDQARIAASQVGAAIAGAAGRVGGRVAPFRRAIGARVRPVVGVVSTLGWIVLASAVVSIVLAVWLGWAEFVFIAATLLAALVIATAFVFGRSTYRVGIELNPRRVVAGERALGRLTVANSGARPVLPTRMELPVGEGQADFTIPRLAPGAETEELFAVPTARRALILAGPAISVRGDQLGLLRRTNRWTDRIELFVHPRTVRLAATARGLVRDLEGQTTKVITDSDLAFHALRTYEPGDDIRNVHWRTSARTGQLMVRQYQETRRSQLLLAFDAERSHFASDDEFELGVSVMTSIGCQVIREETEIDAVWQGGAMRVGTPTALLDDSCRIQPVEGAHATVREFLRQATLRLAAPSLAVTVAGSQVDPGELRAAAALWGTDTETIVIRVDESAEPRLTRLGRSMLLTVSALPELPALLKRAGR